MGVIFRSPDGSIEVVHDTHEQCEQEITAAGLDPTGWTIELTEITHEVNRWPGVRGWPVRVFCDWA